MKNEASLQINLAPVDYPKVTHILPHQLKALGEQFQEILLVLETRMSKKSRFSSEHWQENIIHIKNLASELKKEYPQITLLEIDYSLATRRIVSNYFMRNKKTLIPFKDFRGGPFYSYYFAWYSTQFDYIMHLDADMMIGGHCPTWVAEGLELLERDSTIFSAAPIEGPPIESGKLPPKQGKRYNAQELYSEKPHAYVYQDFSTRIFLINRNKLKGKLRIELPNIDHVLKALWRKQSPYRFPEGTISKFLKKQKQIRVDFLGKAPGFWHLHPRVEAEFWEDLPEIIKKIEENEYPASQKGYRNVSREFWQAVRREKESREIR